MADMDQMNLADFEHPPDGRGTAMDHILDRREFLGTLGAAAASVALAPRAQGNPDEPRSPAGNAPRITPKGKLVLQPFDYRGVSLGPSHWQRQFQSARDYYLAVSDDDILCGFRRAAGLRAPGQPLGGWASPDSSIVFGQWLQAMARTSRANNDA
ncbi:MAG: twin-arginine translocation signal domain-containing protein, partial [Verrucomicrobia bacterium]|nr:twin-arginine translocation signal domain-containing protein [Verrucomicrobiota bacterium]